MRASLSELEAVAAVARHGGFRAAARQLGMSSSALSHAIVALEERLAVRLFNRTTRSVVLSAAGEQFLSEIAPDLQQSRMRSSISASIRVGLGKASAQHGAGSCTHAAGAAATRIRPSLSGGRA
ncbi:LysR family transcriptional regulator [Sinorhizobium meliloti]|uniref:LysR family transcriptional regulator n=1 Tax=Rhizobium meliloti TaxID=382 RepID=UPI001F3C2028